MASVAVRRWTRVVGYALMAVAGIAAMVWPAPAVRAATNPLGIVAYLWRALVGIGGLPWAIAREPSARLGRQLRGSEEVRAIIPRARDYGRNGTMRYSGQLTRAGIDRVRGDPNPRSERRPT